MFIKELVGYQAGIYQRTLKHSIARLTAKGFDPITSTVFFPTSTNASSEPSMVQGGFSQNLSVASIRGYNGQWTGLLQPDGMTYERITSDPSAGSNNSNSAAAAVSSNGQYWMRSESSNPYPIYIYEIIPGGLQTKYSLTSYLPDWPCCGDFSNDNTMFAFLDRDGSRPEVRLIDGGSIVMTRAAGSTNQTHWELKFSPDDQYIAMASNPYQLRVYRISDSTLITLGANTGGSTYSCRWSPNGQFLAAGSTQGVTIYDTTTWQVTGVYNPGSHIWQLDWCGNDAILAYSYNVTDALFMINVGAAGEITRARSLGIPAEQPNFMKIVPRPFSHQIIGTIEENLVASEWEAFAYDYFTGETVGYARFTGTTFNIGTYSNSPVMVTVCAYQGEKWTPDTVVSPGAKVFPTDPLNTPYYFECSQGGTTGATEPVWNITVGGQTTDGQAVWDRVERLIQPVTQSPLIPTPVA